MPSASTSPKDSVCAVFSIPRVHLPMHGTTKRLFFNPLFLGRNMKRVLFNSGPVVHFAKEGSFNEESVYAVPKAIVIKDGLIESIVD